MTVETTNPADETAEPSGRTVKRCEANAVRGTGTGACDRPLNEHGYCDRPSQHITND